MLGQTNCPRWKAHMAHDIYPRSPEFASRTKLLVINNSALQKTHRVLKRTPCEKKSDYYPRFILDVSMGRSVFTGCLLTNPFLHFLHCSLHAKPITICRFLPPVREEAASHAPHMCVFSRGQESSQSQNTWEKEASSVFRCILILVTTGASRHPAISLYSALFCADVE